jgi:hypothetical protein
MPVRICAWSFSPLLLIASIIFEAERERIIDTLRLPPANEQSLLYPRTLRRFNVSVVVPILGLQRQRTANRLTTERTMPIPTDEAIAGQPQEVNAVPQASTADLRRLIDVVWQHATESTAVPSTKTADMLIERAKLHAAPQTAQPTLDQITQELLAHGEFGSTPGSNRENAREAAFAIQQMFTMTRPERAED